MTGMAGDVDALSTAPFPSLLSFITGAEKMKPAVTISKQIIITIIEALCLIGSFDQFIIRYTLL